MDKNILVQNTSNEFDEQIIKELDKIIGITEDNCKLLNTQNNQIISLDDDLNKIENNLNHSYVLLNSMQTFCVNVAKNILTTFNYINPVNYIKKKILYLKKEKYNFKEKNDNINDNSNPNPNPNPNSNPNINDNTNKNPLNIFQYLQFKKNNKVTDLSKMENVDKNTEIIINKLNKLKEMNNEIHDNLSMQNDIIDCHNNQVDKILNTTQNNIKIINELL